MPENPVQSEMIPLPDTVRMVIFDMDGVILDLWAKFVENNVRAAKRMGLPIEPIYSNVRPRGNIHDGVRTIWPNVTDQEAETFIARFREVEQEHPYPLIAGATETIAWVRQHRAKVAICTTNDRATLDHRLKAASLDSSWFSSINTWENFRKPDPRALLSLCDNAGIELSGTIYVGDEYTDVATAKRAGVAFVAVLTGRVSRESFLESDIPDAHIIDSIADLPKILNQKVGKTVD